VLASAAQYDLAAILDQRLVRVCGIGSIFSEQAPRRTGHAEELVERLLDHAARDGLSSPSCSQKAARHSFSETASRWFQSPTFSSP